MLQPTLPLLVSNRLSRQQLRQVLLNYRKKQNVLDIQLASYSIFQKTIFIIEQYKAKNIAIYFSVKGEVQTQALIEYLWKENIHVYLPIIRAPENDLIFRPYDRDSKLIKNQFGIPELEDSGNTIEVNGELDIIFVPLVAFDKNCERLGMGGGYYDRTLRSKREKTITVGLAYSWQEVSQIPAEGWDVPLDMIITDKKIFFREITTA
ncbi:5-formyltetrahydrofolate cyclo-ligase [Actinobacillus delphinicola]|uniref:5-formyltetrahydrofolate cyclo-ligase n=1 Tax=Actinobacillus delphinicola TaxID=51161 RepID=A0A448TUQ7_9PAST|nr:5-formyltetrahydrofolate cyclo-ligase [Actinobacillus delphinicola]VEJ09538.1 5-formyltetrahydrofolate cyclo-ligase [Actinobacillus delphinicola]